jgi:DNA-binding NtrC family response regulator
VLLVGDDVELRELFAHVLELRGHLVLGANDVDQAIQRCRDEHVGVVVIENVMPGGTWAGLAQALIELLGASAPPVVMLAGSWAQADADDAQPGVRTMLAPHRAEQLLDLVSMYCSGIRRLA